MFRGVSESENSEGALLAVDRSVCLFTGSAEEGANHVDLTRNTHTWGVGDAERQLRVTTDPQRNHLESTATRALRGSPQTVLQCEDPGEKSSYTSSLERRRAMAEGKCS
ncbi:hypothetical protein MHYP_G00024750 [Metynnis hypsauchen]